MTGVQKDALSGRLGRRDTVAFSDVGSWRVADPGILPFIAKSRVLRVAFPPLGALRFRAKWKPVRVKKTRQNKRLQLLMPTRSPGAGRSCNTLRRN